MVPEPFPMLALSKRVAPMITVLSPAKSLDYQSSVRCNDFTLPAFTGKSRELIGILKKKSANDIQSLMSVSESLAEENVERYTSWKASRKPGPKARQAAFAFKGDVYLGLDFPTLKARERVYAQRHLRILSGLYGILKPLDLMAPHRLEMGTSLENPKGRSLYAFWNGTQTEFLNEEAARNGSKYLLNLASEEYFKSIDRTALKTEVITPRFLDSKDGKNYRVMSFYAKRSRGTMARWVIQNSIEDPDALISYAEDGYRYDAAGSESDRPTFIRSHA